MEGKLTLEQGQSSVSSPRDEKVGTGGRPVDTAMTDSRKLRILMNNRECARRGRLKKLKYTQELEKQMLALQEEVNIGHAKVNILQDEISLKKNENSSLKQKYSDIEDKCLALAGRRNGEKAKHGVEIKHGVAFIAANSDLQVRAYILLEDSAGIFSPHSTVVSMLLENPVVSDLCATALWGGIAISLLKLWEHTSRSGFFDQKLNRKLVHVSFGLVFMLCWPLFSSGRQGAVLAALIPGVYVIKMLLIGLGIWKDEATVKSMSRFGDYREMLKGPLYYASAITLACTVYWRTSPVAIAACCNLCAGDGLADIVGRRFGTQKLPYNENKSIAGSIAMATAGFVASIIYMHYFAMFGYVRESWDMVLGFLIVSLAAALVESLPISTKLDDNLTVPVTSILLGSLIF